MTLKERAEIARSRGMTTFEWREHKCGGTTYYVSNRACVTCANVKDKARKAASGYWKGKANHTRNWKRLGIIGASEEVYQALLARQGGACLCGRTVNDNGHRLHLDHDHATGQPRAVVCYPCNRLGLGYLDSALRTGDVSKAKAFDTLYRERWQPRGVRIHPDFALPLLHILAGT